MLIKDLSYLENVSENQLVLGSAGTIVIANASATGTSPLAYVNTNTRAINLRNGGSVAVGVGIAVASGVNPSAQVVVGGFGDKVIRLTPNINTPNLDIAIGVVVAIDFPGR
ncbi:hypothetical protein [Fortiea contorta]|uniref:hypothetical protein n=1 Tax=Fortiea contorta TaxID=1892405 RepID=UPI00034703F9|nr:hypothetical protein [Fortiea contorta]